MFGFKTYTWKANVKFSLSYVSFVLFIDASIPQSPHRVKHKERVSDVSCSGVDWCGVGVLQRMELCLSGAGFTGFSSSCSLSHIFKHQLLS